MKTERFLIKSSCYYSSKIADSSFLVLKLTLIVNSLAICEGFIIRLFKTWVLLNDLGDAIALL